MRRLLKSWVFWAFVLPALAAAVLFGLHFESSDLGCACGSKKDRKRLFVGLGTRLRPLLSTESVRPSAFHDEVVAEYHVHAWASENNSFISLGGLGRISCGWSRASPVAYYYGERPAFRGWLKERIASGQLGPAEIQREMSQGTFDQKGKFPFGWTPP